MAGNQILSPLQAAFAADPSIRAFLAAGNRAEIPILSDRTIATIKRILPSYVYQQYLEDNDIEAFFAALNEWAQVLANNIYSLNMPDYRGLDGPLLDWCAVGIYGLLRPNLRDDEAHVDGGAYNDVLYNNLLYNGGKFVPENFIGASDDVFKRCLTWNLYKGDGKQFTVRWLKRRVNRWLYGAAEETYRVSVTFGPAKQVFITVPDSFDAELLEKAIISKAVQTPLTYNFFLIRI